MATKTCLYARLQFTISGTTYSPSKTRAQVVAAAGLVTSFYQEASYGTQTWTNTVSTGVINLGTVTNSDLSSIFSLDAVAGPAVTSAGFTLSSFDVVGYLIPTSYSLATGGESGESNRGNRFMVREDDYADLINPGIVPAITIHELGHCLGLDHMHSWYNGTNGSAANITFSTTPTTVQEYVPGPDMMGSPGTIYVNHPNIYEKNQLGFIALGTGAGQVLTIDTTIASHVDQFVTLDANENPTPAFPRGIRIKVKSTMQDPNFGFGPIDRIWVECRDPSRFSPTFGAPFETSSIGKLSGGAFITLNESAHGADGSWLVDGSPGDQWTSGGAGVSNDMASPCLPPGSVRSNASANIWISCESWDAANSRATVRVYYDSNGVPPGQYAWYFGGDWGGGFCMSGAVNPADPSRMVAGGDTWGPRVTSNGGAQWDGGGYGVDFTNAAFRRCHGTAVSQKNPGVFYVGTADQNGKGHFLKVDGLHASEIGTLSFGDTSATVESSATPRRNQRIVVDYDSTKNIEYLFIATANQGIVRLKDEVPTSLWGGASVGRWQGICAVNAGQLIVSSSEPGGSTTATLTYLLTATGGDGTLRGCTSLSPTLLSNAPHAVWQITKWSDGTIYAACGASGIYRVTNSNTTWTPIWTGNGAGEIVRTLDGSGSVMMAGLANLSARGHSVARTTTLTSNNSPTFTFVGDNENGTVYGTNTTWWGMAGASGHVPASLGDPNFDCADLWYLPGTNNQSFVVFGRAGAWRTDDQGANWHPMMAGMNGATCGGAINVSTGGIVNWDGGDWPGFHSSDHGKTVIETATSPAGTQQSSYTVNGNTYTWTTGIPVDVKRNGTSIFNNYARAAATDVQTFIVSPDEYVYVVQKGGGLLIGDPSGGPVNTPQSLSASAAGAASVATRVNRVGQNFSQSLAATPSAATTTIAAAKSKGVSTTPAASTGAASIATSVTPATSEITIDTSRPVHGADCIKINAKADGLLHYLQRTGISSTRIVARFFINFSSAPSVTRLNFFGCTTGPNIGVTSGLAPSVSMGGVSTDAAFTFTLNTWYRLDVRFDTGTSTWTTDYFVSSADGGILYTSPTLTKTSQAASPRVDFRLGELTDGALIFYVDDIKVQSDGYPIGWSGPPPNSDTPLIDTGWEGATVTGNGVTGTVGSPVVTTSQFAHGKSSMQCPWGSSATNLSFNTTVIVGRVFFRLDLLPNGNLDLVHAHMSGGGNADITIGSNGKIIAGADGPSVIYSTSTASTFTLSTNTWYLLDYSFDASDGANVVIQYQVSSLSLSILQASTSFTAPVGTASSFSQHTVTASSGIVAPLATNNSVNAYYDDWRVQTKGYPIGYQPTATNYFQVVTANAHGSPLPPRRGVGIIDITATALSDANQNLTIGPHFAASTNAALATLATSVHTAIHNFAQSLAAATSAATTSASRTVGLHPLSAPSTGASTLTAPQRVAQRLTATATTTATRSLNVAKKISSTAHSALQPIIHSTPVTLAVIITQVAASGVLGIGEPGFFGLGSNGVGSLYTSIQTAVTRKLNVALTISATSTSAASTIKAAASKLAAATSTASAAVATTVTTAAHIFTRTLAAATNAATATTTPKKSFGAVLSATAASAATMPAKAISVTLRAFDTVRASIRSSYGIFLLTEAVTQARTILNIAPTLAAATASTLATITKNVSEGLSAKITTRLRGRHKKQTDHADAETTSDDKGTPL